MKIILIFDAFDIVDVIYYLDNSTGGRLREFYMLVKTSQIMRKLNPRKRPRIPPQSATRDRKGKASCSFSRRIVWLPKIRVIWVNLLSWANCGPPGS